MTSTDACEERHKALTVMIRNAICLAIFSILSVGGLYLYGNEKYAPKEEANHIRQDIKDLKAELKDDMRDGFDRIEKRLNKP